MTLEEFIDASNRLEKYFGKEYEYSQIEIMHSQLRDWNIEKYKKAVEWALMNCKYLPKLADFNEYMNNQKVNTGTDFSKNAEENFVRCNKCNRGFITYWKEFEGLKYSYQSLCNCANAQVQINNGYGFLPRYNQLFSK